MTLIALARSALTRGNLRLTIPGAQAGPGLLAGVTGGINAWLARHEERRQLRSLDEATLHDIGLSAADVERESSKPFWQA